MWTNRGKLTMLFLMSMHSFSLCFGQGNNSSEIDSTYLMQVLSKQHVIPGVGYRLILPSNANLDESLVDTLINLLTPQNAISKRFERLQTAIEIQEVLLLQDSVSSQLQISLYAQTISWQTLADHVNNLIITGELDTTSKLAISSDLITLAHKAPYLTSKKQGFGFFSDLKIFIITVVIISFTLVTIGMIVFMLVYKISKNKAERLSEEYDTLIVSPLSEILFDKDIKAIESLSDEELYQSFPAQLLKKSLYKKVLIERVIAMNKTMKGDFKAKLKALYKRLDFDRISINSLSSRKWDRVVAGLVQINEMDLFEAVPQVKKHVNSSNFYIRSQAVATLLNISTTVDLSFLRDQTFPLSGWQQMNYLRIIRYLHTQRELDLESLFSSRNQSIRLFSYKLVRILGRVDLVQKMIDVFEEVSEDEKIEMLQTFETLGVQVDSLLINLSLKSGNEKLVLRAAKAAGQIGDEEAEKMLWEILPQSTSFRLKMTTLKSLKSLNKSRYTEFLAQTEEDDFKLINKHLLDPILQDV